MTDWLITLEVAVNPPEVFMQTQEQRSTYHHLELITASTLRQQRIYRLVSILKSVWKSILLVLLDTGEPRISQAIDSKGKRYWRIHDPRTGRSVRCESEQEVRAWLEVYLTGHQVQSPDCYIRYPFPNQFR